MAGDGVVLIIFSSSLTGFQNLVVVCHSAWSYVRCARNLERWNPAPWEVGLADPVERRPPCMRHVPNLVVLDQTAVAYVLQRFLRFVGKLTPSVQAFQRHSMYLDPTRIDRLPMTSY